MGLAVGQERVTRVEDVHLGVVVAHGGEALAELRGGLGQRPVARAVAGDDRPDAVPWPSGSGDGRSWPRRPPSRPRRERVAAAEAEADETDVLGREARLLA